MSTMTPKWLIERTAEKLLANSLFRYYGTPIFTQDVTRLTGCSTDLARETLAYLVREEYLVHCSGSAYERTRKGAE